MGEQTNKQTVNTKMNEPDGWRDWQTEGEIILMAFHPAVNRYLDITNNIPDAMWIVINQKTTVCLQQSRGESSTRRFAHNTFVVNGQYQTAAEKERWIRDKWNKKINKKKEKKERK